MASSEKDLVRLAQGAALVLARLVELRPVTTGGRSPAAAAAAHERWSNATAARQIRTNHRETFPSEPSERVPVGAEARHAPAGAWQRVEAPHTLAPGVHSLPEHESVGHLDEAGLSSSAAAAARDATQTRTGAEAAVKTASAPTSSAHAAEFSAAAESGARSAGVAAETRAAAPDAHTSAPPPPDHAQRPYDSANAGEAKSSGRVGGTRHVSKVPSGQLERVARFTSLGFGMAFGAVGSMVGSAVSGTFGANGGIKGALLSAGNSDRWDLSSASVGLADYSQADMLGVWYKPVNCGAEKSLVSPNW
ncbi:hypothetical protein T484DRAFT_1767298 [Baffinella frigidus]|nr:hypothetical protein T484DRAFT_1767298 [Cryptophyta sp. CCMP2293]